MSMILIVICLNSFYWLVNNDQFVNPDIIKSSQIHEFSPRFPMFSQVFWLVHWLLPDFPLVGMPVAPLQATSGTGVCPRRCRSRSCARRWMRRSEDPMDGGRWRWRLGCSAGGWVVGGGGGGDGVMG